MMLNKNLWEKRGLTYVPADVSISGNHVYTKNSDKSKLTGVTTIIGNMSKDFMAPWAVKEFYEYMVENWDLSKTYTSEESEELLLTAKKQYNVKSAEARKIGTIVHEWVSNHIQGKDSAIPNIEEVKNSIKSFLDFEKDHKIEWLLSEEIICSVKKYKKIKSDQPLTFIQKMLLPLFMSKFEETDKVKGEIIINVAGTLDFLAYIDGVLTLGDFKTSKRISEETYLQLGAYDFFLKEQMGFNSEQRMIVRIPKDKSDVEVAVVDTPLKFDQATFFNLKQVHRWKVNIKNNFSEKVGRFNKLKIKNLTTNK